MELLHLLRDRAVWQEFLEYKLSGGHLSKAEEKALSEFVREEAYLPVVDKILRGEAFAPPKKAAISKLHSGKKRIVYTYAEDENRVLKLLTFLLHRRYDHLFADNLYSFRRYKGVRDALTKLTGTPKLRQMWTYKVDISNYFNSVPVERLLPQLQQVLSRLPETYGF